VAALVSALRGAAAASVGLVAVTLLLVVLTPVGLVLAAVLLAGNAMCPRRRVRVVLPPRDASAASIMVLNWNGRAFLERLLPTLDAAVAVHGGAHEVIVVDNGSQDDSVAWLRAHFPHVRIVQHARNEKFVHGYNLALPAATKDIVVVLNNDMVVDRDFLAPLLDAMAAHPQAFAVAARIEMQDQALAGMETGRTGGAWSCGLFKVMHQTLPEDADGVWPCLWAGGGAAAIDRRALVAQGGFETLFAPYYFEDTSLGYQAWKRGQFVLLAPRAVVVHAHRGSSAHLRPAHLERVLARNGYLFAWRSFDDAGRTCAVAAALPLTAARAALRAGLRGAARRSAIELAALGSAFAHLPAVLRARAATRRTAARTDREVLALAHSRHLLARALGSRPTSGSKLRLLLLLARVPRRHADGSWVQFELLRRLGARHHVTVFALAETHEIAAQANELAPFVARVETRVLTREPARCDLLRQDPKGFRRDYSDAGIRARVRTLLAETAFDVVQVDYAEMAYVVEGLLSGVAAVHVVHEPMASAAWPGQGGMLRPTFERARAINMEARLLRQFARVVCMTPTDAATLRRSGSHHAPVVITNGIDVGRYEPAPPSAAPTLLFMGSYDHDPNVAAAFLAAREVLPRVRACIPQARLLLAGRDAGKRLAPLHELPGVDILGFVPDLTATVRAAGCFFTPLCAGGGMRSKVLEAMAWGKPLVGTPLAFTGIAGTHGQHYLVADDSEALAAACTRVLTEDDLRARLGQAARDLVERAHSAAAMTAAYEALYYELARAPEPT
jgi:GT2 family glycosyltransferase/glycosyltransferase involved in cell wall biosynthesis